MEIFKTTRAPRRLGRAAKPVLRLLYPHDEGHVLTGATRTYLEAKGVKLDAQPVTVTPAALEEAKSRLVMRWAALVADSLPDATRDEVLLYLWSNPTATVEYMGRGTMFDEATLPADRSKLLSLDRAGGQRRYVFRHLDGGAKSDDRSVWAEAIVAGASKFLHDDDAKLVLSLGGGGFRMFGATPVLQMLDSLLDSRERLKEVWGSSGGAFLGYVYSQGFEPRVIDEFGYDLCHDRNKSLINGSNRSILRMGYRAARDSLLGREHEPAFVGWVRALQEKQPESERAARIPFYAAASTLRTSEGCALADPQDVPDYCSDFVLPCDPIRAVAASTAVPFLVPAQTGIAGEPDDVWLDGSITDENPLMLPYLKWMRELEEVPGTPKKLKILLVNLNLRTTESAVVRRVRSMTGGGASSPITKMARVLDMVLDSRTAATLKLLTENRNVEVLALKMKVGQIALKNPRSIPSLIRTGRAFESWTVSTHRRSAR